jgi:hypothetical protein
MEEWRERLDRMDALMAQNLKGFAELRELQKKNEAENAKGFAELRELQKKNEEIQKNNEAENAKSFERINKLQEENARQIEENSRLVKETTRNINGISRSNGKVSDEYFYNSLNTTKMLGGVHFDYLKRHLKNSIPIGEGKTLDGEYDITMINGNSIGLVEVKYTVVKDDVDDLVDEQIKNFKQLFPMYADYKFYLGIGGMSFDKQAEDTAKKLGICMLKFNGDAVEIYDTNLKVY